MTTVGSCDHHDEYGLVPSNRSRARILEQLRAASALGESLGRGVEAGRIRSIDGALCLILPLESGTALIQSLQAWRDVAPRGDDFAPPVVPPAEVRVPPIDPFDSQARSGQADTTEAS